MRKPKRKINLPAYVEICPDFGQIEKGGGVPATTPGWTIVEQLEGMCSKKD